MKPGKPAKNPWHYVKKTKTCWLWVGSKTAAGYGQIHRRPKTFLAHRFFYGMHFGAIPSGKWILHKCDNPSCVRPTHLFAGTRKDNIRDMVQKGRGLVGSKNGQAKLSEEKVRRARQMHSEFKYSHKWLADYFGVARRTMSHIILRDKWKHI